jgi:hypothetical protein
MERIYRRVGMALVIVSAQPQPNPDFDELFEGLRTCAIALQNWSLYLERQFPKDLNSKYLQAIVA